MLALATTSATASFVRPPSTRDIAAARPRLSPPQAVFGGRDRGAPPIDEERRRRSPGLQNNFYDVPTADFKRPVGADRSASPPPGGPGWQGRVGPAAAPQRNRAYEGTGDNRRGFNRGDFNRGGPIRGGPNRGDLNRRDLNRQDFSRGGYSRGEYSRGGFIGDYSRTGSGGGDLGAGEQVLWFVSQLALCSVVFVAPYVDLEPSTIAFGWFIFATGGVLTAESVGSVRKNELRTDGPFALCRHPSYTGLVLLCAGVGFATLSSERLAVTWLLFALLRLQARREEEQLEQQHGEYFRAWAREVPPFWPRWSAIEDGLKGNRRSGYNEYGNRRDYDNAWGGERRDNQDYRRPDGY